MQLALCSLMGYFFGNINPAYIISKFRGFDIRDRGSGNAGASNVTMIMGKKAGFLTALLDILKAAVVTSLAAALFPNIKFAKILAGSSCVIGHIFPVLMKFHGGKGLACLAGMIISYDSQLFFNILIIELFLGLGFDYICIVPMSGSLLFTSIYALSTGDPSGTLILATVSIIILIKHIENIYRIENGTEAHISILWKKDKELKRLKEHEH